MQTDRFSLYDSFQFQEHALDWGTENTDKSTPRVCFDFLSPLLSVQCCSWNGLFFTHLVTLSFAGQRYGPGALRPPLLPERAKNYKRPSTNCHMQFEHHTANPQKGRIHMFEWVILFGHIISSTFKWIEIACWHWEEPSKFIGSRGDCLLLVSFISV